MSKEADSENSVGWFQRPRQHVSYVYNVYLFESLGSRSVKKPTKSWGFESLVKLFSFWRRTEWAFWNSTLLRFYEIGIVLLSLSCRYATSRTRLGKDCQEAESWWRKIPRPWSVYRWSDRSKREGLWGLGVLVLYPGFDWRCHLTQPPTAQWPPFLALDRRLAKYVYYRCSS